MNVLRAIELLKQLPPDAEVMIDAPFDCSQGRPIIAETRGLTLPVRSIRKGILYTPHPPGSSWVMFMGTAAWGQDQGIEP